MKRIILIFGLLFLSLQGLRAQESGSSDRSGLVVREWNSDIGSEQKRLDRVTTYNALGRKLEEIEYGNDGQKWRKRYEYDADGKLLRVLVYGHRDKLDNVRKFEFNEMGRKKTEYIYDAKGKLRRIKYYEYEHRDD
jgi:uncharacterized protein YxeA